jgi:hypothetical protein
VLALVAGACAIVGRRLDTGADLLALLRAGTVGPELFTLPHGISEFDLVYEDGLYHLWYSTYDHTEATHHRSASTIAGLAAAADTTVLSGWIVPSAIKIASTWHIWAAAFSGTARHWTAIDPDGPYVFSDDLPAGTGDPHVRYRPTDGRFYCTYASGPPAYRVGLLRATDPAGPWTNLGFIYPSKESWYSTESDPGLAFSGDRVFVAHSGGEGSIQRCGMCEIDTDSWRAMGPGTILVEPTEAWEQRNGGHHVFNPVWLPKDRRLYFAHNPGYAGAWYDVETGWGYLAAP